jgi:hypothetical protein
MDAATRASASKTAEQHPDFKVFLQKIEMPTILVVPENTTDDQLKSLLWFLRIQVREGNFKALGLHPTATIFDKPGYSSGILNIYRGSRCAGEMYVISGPDPCGASIHKSASYHWGEGGDPRADGGDYIPQSGGADVLLFTADDGWQTDAEARTDPDGSKQKAAAARFKYPNAENAKMVKQGSDVRVYVDQLDTELGIVSYQLTTDAAQKTFLSQFLTLEQDHLCPLGFTSIKLGVRGAPGKSYPLDCSTTK